MVQSPWKENIFLFCFDFLFFLLVSALLRDYSLCWDRWKLYMIPTLDAALLISSWAGAYLDWIVFELRAHDCYAK